VWSGGRWVWSYVGWKGGVTVWSPIVLARLNWGLQIGFPPNPHSFCCELGLPPNLQKNQRKSFREKSTVTTRISQIRKNPEIRKMRTSTQNAQNWKFQKRQRKLIQKKKVRKKPCHEYFLGLWSKCICYNPTALGDYNIQSKATGDWQGQGSAALFDFQSLGV